MSYLVVIFPLDKKRWYVGRFRKLSKGIASVDAHERGELRFAARDHHPAETQGGCIVSLASNVGLGS